ncbi:hypothetical protein, unlikely [Trypanosoma brucei gambiense DAL972]|uniref:Uncharacterized protein n=1 Tax=Trypanosoma brucei gambiense (strain MHOM/CI/86/DAL972) TaxID=679716 RepID=D0A521_TRYB9|nr:hypothetical protein, unlikely [Trypanosoma brucei gambiense DAL972]CBH16365.1 hypothetical protein, unlikely [Trypanosoma brucei gambiense DAL972]|eukprot:XP_011778629.1 hypothetical protein, unlikely [Trypanosoma brucei gambiense DAL972]
MIRPLPSRLQSILHKPHCLLHYSKHFCVHLTTRFPHNPTILSSLADATSNRKEGRNKIIGGHRFSRASPSGAEHTTYFRWSPLQEAPVASSVWIPDNGMQGGGG